MASILFSVLELIGQVLLAGLRDVGILRLQTIQIQSDEQGLEVGLHAGLAGDRPLVWVQDHVDLLVLHPVKAFDSVLVQIRANISGITRRDHDNPRWLPLAVGDGDAEVCSILFALVPCRQISDIPALVLKLLDLLGVVDEDGEVSIAFAVVLSLASCEVSEDDLCVFDGLTSWLSLRHTLLPFSLPGGIGLIGLARHASG